MSSCVTTLNLDSQTKEKLNLIVSISKEVARGLGKGREENVYQKALSNELQKKRVIHNSEETIPIIYKGIGVGYERMDITIDESSFLGIILELKAISGTIQPKHIWQLHSYMLNIEYKYGVVINFNQGINEKPLEFCFIIIHEGKPYIYQLETGKAIFLKTSNSYDYDDVYDGREVMIAEQKTIESSAPIKENNDQPIVNQHDEDNKYKHLSVKQLKELMRERKLKPKNDKRDILIERLMQYEVETVNNISEKGWFIYHNDDEKIFIDNSEGLTDKNALDLFIKTHDLDDSCFTIEFLEKA